MGQSSLPHTVGPKAISTDPAAAFHSLREASFFFTAIMQSA
jgi:hypothetical protein